jgi:hypothetical protein
MPWCETCSRFLNPNTLHPDGTCPECGRQVADPPATPSDAAPADAAPGEGSGGRGEQAEPRQKAPWHFKLLLVGVVVYLTYRFIQIGGWIVHWLTR